MKKLKGGVSKVGKSVQTAASSASDSVQVESEYLSRKGKSDFSAAFPHDEPILTKVKIFHSYAKHNETKNAFDRLLNIQKDTLKAEEKAAKDFKEHSTGLTLISNQERFAQFGTSCDALTNPRKEFIDALQAIRDEWTHVVSDNHGKAHNQLERINKLWVEVFVYSKAVNRKKEEMRTRQKYEDALYDFTEAANEYIRLLDKGYLEWFDKVRNLQLDFYKKCADAMYNNYAKLPTQETTLAYSPDIFLSYQKKHIDYSSSSSSSD